MRAIEKIDGFISLIENVVAVILLSLMLVVSFVQVILRNFFETGLIWADPFLRYCVLWIAFVGASIATSEDRHINIDVLSRILQPKMKKIVSILTTLFSSIICAVLAKASVDFIKIEIQFPSEIFLGINAWVLELIVPFGFVLMSFRFFLRFLKIAKGRSE